MCAVILIATMTGCKSGTTGGTAADTVTVDNITSRVQEATPNLKTYVVNMDMTMGMKGEIGGEAGDITLSVAAEGSVDMEQRKMGMNMTLDMSGTGGDQQIDETMNALTYIVGDMMYVGTAAEGGDVQWQSQIAPVSTWDQQNQLELQLKLFEGSQITSLRQETVDGVACYRVEISPDLATLWDMVGQQFGDATSGVDVADLKDTIKTVSVRYWFAKDNLFMKKGFVHMEMQLTAAQLGEEGPGSLDMTIEITMDFSKHNQPVTITVPAEATAQQ